MLTDFELIDYAGYLYCIARANHDDKDVAMIRASAPQKAEAFIRTIYGRAPEKLSSRNPNP